MIIQFNYILLFLIILVDILNINKLWCENYIRRVLHHLQRSLYNPNKVPEIYLNMKLENKNVEYLKTLKYKNKNLANTKYPFLSDFVSGIYSTKSNIFYTDFDTFTQAKLKEIGNSLIPGFEKHIGKKLYLMKDVCFILRYEGENAHFNWHYDNEHKSCYRALFLFRKEGLIPDFLYKDKNGEIQNVKYEEGDGIIFKGKFTHHGVNKSDDKNTKRYIISFQYTTEPAHYHKSLCSELSDTTLFETLKIFLPNILFYWGITLFSMVYFKNYICKLDGLFVITLCVLAYTYLSCFSDKTSDEIGNKIKIDYSFFLKFSCFILINIIKPVESLIFIFYILLTESLLPSRYLILK